LVLAELALAADALEDVGPGAGDAAKVVYCKDDDRRRTYPNEKFDFLGYTFRPRRSKNRRGKFFINFCGRRSGSSGSADRCGLPSYGSEA
jgi:hypothetical protein